MEQPQLHLCWLKSSLETESHPHPQLSSLGFPNPEDLDFVSVSASSLLNFSLGGVETLLFVPIYLELEKIQNAKGEKR